MIFIDLKNNPPPPDIIKQGMRLTTKLSEITGSEKKKEFITTKVAYWRDLKPHYEELSHGKCWYTEVKELASHYHMDHFRPKSNKNKCYSTPHQTVVKKGGYNCLAFDWENYRLSAGIPNGKKSNYFPLRKGSKQTYRKSTVSREQKALLDPTIEADTKLIGFEPGGTACPTSENSNSWAYKRADITIDIYDLNSQNLIDKRIEISNKCKRILYKIKNLVINIQSLEKSLKVPMQYPINRQILGKSLKVPRQYPKRFLEKKILQNVIASLKRYLQSEKEELAQMIEPQSEFSATARDCIKLLQNTIST